jgi:hypothetical protein
VAERLAASQEGLSSMELVVIGMSDWDPAILNDIS